MEARIAGPTTQRIAESVAARFGAKATPLNYKSPASIARKLKANPNKPVKDGARTTIIVSSEKIGDVVKALNGNPMKADYKEHKPKEMAGYSGHLFNFKIKGITTEIQVNTPEMIFAKEPMNVVVKLLGKKEYQRIRKETGQFAGWGHKYYEDFRTKRSDNPKRRNGNSSKLDSKIYYENFRK